VSGTDLIDLRDLAMAQRGRIVDTSRGRKSIGAGGDVIGQHQGLNSAEGRA